MDAPAAFVRRLFGCGVLYYGYNEMGFRVLDLLSPVSAAVANSLKRVAVLLAAVAFLGEVPSTRKVVGSAVAMGGVLLYSLAKARASKLPPKKVEITVAADEAGAWQP
jgi:solute carrier family 35 protein E1